VPCELCNAEIIFFKLSKQEPINITSKQYDCYCFYFIWALWLREKSHSKRK